MHQISTTFDVFTVHRTIVSETQSYATIKVKGVKDELFTDSVHAQPLAIAAAIEIERLKAELAKASEFKAYVHQRLDEAGVPVSPEPARTAQTGCRIGERLTWLLNADRLKRMTAQAVVWHERFDRAAALLSGVIGMARTEWWKPSWEEGSPEARVVRNALAFLDETKTSTAPAPDAVTDAQIMDLYDSEIHHGGSADSVILRTVRAALNGSLYKVKAVSDG